MAQPGGAPVPGDLSPADAIQPELTRPPSASDLINRAVEERRLDSTTALVYRVLAMFGDERVPEEFRGEWAEDSAALDLAEWDLDQLPSEARGMVIPFLVRPTDPRSIWSTPQQSRSGVGGSTNVLLEVEVDRPRDASSAPQLQAACVNGWIRERVTSLFGTPLPVLISVQCDASGNPPANIRTWVTNAIRDLWGPMTKLMGDPIPDGLPQGAPTALPEEGDGLLDIYIVWQSQQRGTRWLNPGEDNKAFVRGAAPFRGSAGAEQSSGYMVVNPFRGGTEPGVRSTVAHELFHVLQNAHNHNGMLTPDGWHWFSEASARWAEHFFVPEARFVPYVWFGDFQDTGQGLSWPKDRNPYMSWVWPLFMQQEGGKTGEQMVAQAWTKFEGKSGFDAIQVELDRQLGFAGHFRDFAVRAWNEDLPGHPFTTFQELDPKLPRSRPGAARLGSLGSAILVARVPPVTRAVDIPSLRPIYFQAAVGGDVRRLTLDFSGLSPVSALSVDALIKLENKGWERRKLPFGQTIFCIDREPVEKLILVISNHDWRSATRVTGDFTITPETEGCPSVVSARVAYSFLLHSRQDNRSLFNPYDVDIADVTEAFDGSVILLVASDGFPERSGPGEYRRTESTSHDACSSGVISSRGPIVLYLSGAHEGTEFRKDAQGQFRPVELFTLTLNARGASVPVTATSWGPEYPSGQPVCVSLPPQTYTENPHVLCSFSGVALLEGGTFFDDDTYKDDGQDPDNVRSRSCSIGIASSSTPTQSAPPRLPLPGP